MDFSGALAALKAGKIVRNNNWNGKSMYLTILIHPNVVPAIYLHMPDTHPVYPHASVPWTPSQLDLMSEEWEICRPEAE
jgi:hypothetical protein